MEMKPREISSIGYEGSLQEVESYPWSPTREQVDAYIRSLEWQVLQKDVGIPSCHAKEYRAAGMSRQPLASSRFFLGLIAVALGCFAWLLQITYEALK